MTRIDNLPPDQQAVLELVLRRGRDYDDIARLLSVDRADVRARALGALEAIGPRLDVPPEHRGLITDYLLGQLPAAVAAEVHERLSTTEADREWARAVAAELTGVAERPLPDVPAATANGASADRRPAAPASTAVDEAAPASTAPDDARPATATPDEAAPATTAPDDPRPATAAPHEADPATAAPAPTGTAAGRPRLTPPRRGSRVGGAFLLGMAALVIAVVLVVVFVITPGGATRHRSATTPTTGAAGATTGGTGTTTAAKPQELGTYRLKAVAAGSKAQGIAEAVSEGGQRLLALVAINLAPNSHNYYAVWLTKGSAAVLVGYERVAVTKTGRLQAFAPLPANASRYTTIVLAQQPGSPPSNGPTSLGTPVLSGPFTLK